MKNVDWTGIGITVGLGAIGFILVRAVETAFPQVQKVTRLPDKALSMVAPKQA